MIVKRIQIQITNNEISKTVRSRSPKLTSASGKWRVLSVCVTDDFDVKRKSIRPISHHSMRVSRLEPEGAMRRTRRACAYAPRPQQSKETRMSITTKDELS